MKLLRWAGWTYALHLLTLFGLALSNGFLILTLLLAAPALRARAFPWRRLRPLYLPLGVYVLLLGAAVVASPEPRQSARSLSEILALMTLAAGPLLVRGERARRRLTDALVASGALLALYGLAQTLAGYGDLERRIRGPFSHWMTFAGVLLLCDLLLIARLSVDPASRRLWPWPWRWAALAAINLALLGSLTRNAWLALGVTLVIFFGARRPRVLALLPPAAVLFVLLAPVPVLSRVLSITNLRDPSNYDRLCMADAGRRMITEHPVFGIGPDLVPHRYGLYRHPTAPRYWVPHLHNTFLELAAERGLPALLAYLGLMAASAWLAMRRYRGEGGDAGPRADLYLGVILGLFAFNLAGLFEFNWGDVEVQRVALFLLALPFCLAVGEDEELAGAG
jgi:putative inorganic carbon (HCO3(-)) transporter